MSVHTFFTGVRGVIAPHIDFHRGGPAYAWAYRDVAERYPQTVWGERAGECLKALEQPAEFLNAQKAEVEAERGAGVVDEAELEDLAHHRHADVLRQQRLGDQLRGEVEHDHH